MHLKPQRNLLQVNGTFTWIKLDKTFLSCRKYPKASLTVNIEELVHSLEQAEETFERSMWEPVP